MAQLMLAMDPVVTDAEGLITALDDKAPRVRIAGRITGLPPLALADGQVIEGVDGNAALAFAGDGLALAPGCTVAGLSVQARRDCDALRLDDTARDCGEITIEDVNCTGAVRIFFGADAGPASLVIRCLLIGDADTVARLPRPFGNGVEVQQGAITIWNRAYSAPINIDATQISVGSPDAPVRGCGIFVAGDAERGCTLRLTRFETEMVHADSGLTPDVTGTVSGGVFLLGGVIGEHIVSTGAIETHGANSVPVDTWGDIGVWQVNGPVTSHGPSAVGFVNAGTLRELHLQGGIVTHGDGARACCIYGSTGTIRAASIATYGCAASGVQVVATLDRLIVDHALTTHGDAGEGLVKGKLLPAFADAIHVEPGGRLGAIESTSIMAHGEGALLIRNEGTIDAPGDHPVTHIAE